MSSCYLSLTAAFLHFLEEYEIPLVLVGTAIGACAAALGFLINQYRVELINGVQTFSQIVLARRLYFGLVVGTILGLVFPVLAQGNAFRFTIEPPDDVAATASPVTLWGYVTVDNRCANTAVYVQEPIERSWILVDDTPVLTKKARWHAQVDLDRIGDPPKRVAPQQTVDLVIVLHGDNSPQVPIGSTIRNPPRGFRTLDLTIFRTK